MDYIDLQGKKVSNITNQDKLLSFLYTNIFGRMLLKPLIQPQVSKLAGRYLSSAHSKWLISKFIERNEINMDIYEECDYSSFNDFFTRKIKPDCRPVPEDLDVLISPCDCLATVYPIQENTTFSIKNTEYTLRSLLRSPRLAKRFRGGYAYILRRLSPLSLLCVRETVEKLSHRRNFPHGKSDCQRLPSNLQRKHARIHSNSLKRIWRCTPDGSRCSLSWQNFKPQTKHSRNPWRRKRIL